MKRNIRFGILLGLLLMAFLLSGCQGKTAPAPAPAISAEETLLVEMVPYRTDFIGDASKVSHIASLLPAPDKALVYDHIVLQTDAPPYGLTIYYTINPEWGAKEGALDQIAANPYFFQKNENNALITFANIANLDEVTFVYQETPENPQTVRTMPSNEAFRRSDFVEAYGDLTALGEDLPTLAALLQNNQHLMAERLHYNRTRLHSEEEMILYRNGAPQYENTDGLDGKQLTYTNLGAVTITSDDGATTQPLEEDTVLVEYTLAKAPDGLYRVKQLRLQGGSEMLVNLNITPQSTKTEILYQLGTPDEEISRTITNEPASEETTHYYRLDHPNDDYAFFGYSDERLIDYGLVSGLPDHQ